MAEINKQELIDKLAQAGGFYGYSKQKRHSSVRKFVDSNKNGRDIIDLEKTAEQVIAACDFIKGLIANKKQVLFIGTKAEAREKVRTAGMLSGMPFAADRFIGGSLTNFSEIRKRVERLADFTAKREKGEFGVYTKKEQLLIDRDIARMTKNFGGLATIATTLPGAIILVDSKTEDIALKEALYARVPTISLSNTDCDISKIDFPIVVNDASSDTVGVVLNYLKEATQVVA
jgi:small subunit ribosomal protein S2